MTLTPPPNPFTAPNVLDLNQLLRDANDIRIAFHGLSDGVRTWHRRADRYGGDAGEPVELESALKNLSDLTHKIHKSIHELETDILDILETAEEYVDGIRRARLDYALTSDNNLCQDCWEAAYPDQYFPDASHEGKCGGCGEELAWVASLGDIDL